ncbi:hypothetical protein ACOBR2_20125 [Telmatobacter bradus]|uniref:hypothetical protein n=1 Tax=Telmatobacter bradus TaxID=474953 RepID=UPI003B43585B
MNRYLLIRRLYGPAFLLLTGVNALLSQADILGWGHSWPFYLILLGVLKLAERAALAVDGPPIYPQSPFPGQPFPGQSYPGQHYPGQPFSATAQQPVSTEPGTAIVATPVHEIVHNPQGGQQ